tara:strand:- start:2010 stop:2183 length:174 start_codon:yes stop_codon:yes gene_type:complete
MNKEQAEDHIWKMKRVMKENLIKVYKEWSSAENKEKSEVEKKLQRFISYNKRYSEKN